jgi:hypothetical protein
MIRSLLALGAFGWFAFNAMEFLPDGAYLNDGASGGIDGDPGAVAVTWAARNIFIGLAILSVALIDWDWVARLATWPDDPPRADG